MVMSVLTELGVCSTDRGPFAKCKLRTTGCIEPAVVQKNTENLQNSISVWILNEIGPVATC